MTLIELLNWLLIPALAGLAWIARSVSRLETESAQLRASNTELWKHVNELTKGIAELGKEVAALRGRMEK